VHACAHGQGNYASLPFSNSVNRLDCQTACDSNFDPQRLFRGLANLHGAQHLSATPEEAARAYDAATIKRNAQFSEGTMIEVIDAEATNQLKATRLQDRRRREAQCSLRSSDRFDPWRDQQNKISRASVWLITSYKSRLAITVLAVPPKPALGNGRLQRQVRRAWGSKGALAPHYYR
jgi:hypothetical protein